MKKITRRTILKYRLRYNVISATDTNRIHAKTTNFRDHTTITISCRANVRRERVSLVNGKRNEYGCKSRDTGYIIISPR